MHYSLFDPTYIVSERGIICSSSLGGCHKFNRSIIRIHSVKLLLLVIGAIVYNISILLRITIGSYVLDYLLLKTSMIVGTYRRLLGSFTILIKPNACRLREEARDSRWYGSETIISNHALVESFCHWGHSTPNVDRTFHLIVWLVC